MTPAERKEYHRKYYKEHKKQILTNRRKYENNNVNYEELYKKLRVLLAGKELAPCEIMNGLKINSYKWSTFICSATYNIPLYETEDGKLGIYESVN